MNNYSLYFNKEISDLKINDCLGWEALELHWIGKFPDAKNVYEKILEDVNLGQDDWSDLLFADYCLLLVKMGITCPEKYDIKKIKFSDAKMVIKYAQLYQAFWVDHKVAQRLVWSILKLSLVSNCKSFMLTGIFIYFHLKTIKGSKIVAFNFARLTYFVIKNKVEKMSLPKFGSSVVIASYPYTLFMSGRIYGKGVEQAITFAEKNIGEDPFYQSLFLISGFYTVAYSGDIARTEIYGHKFDVLHRYGKLVRYLPVTPVMKLLPQALRGYGPLIEKEFNAIVEAHKDSEVSLINSQFYRASAVISLMLGKNEGAKRFIEKTLLERAKTNSFVGWNSIDLRIKALSSRKIAFNPQKDDLFGFKTDFGSQPPQLSSVLFRLLNTIKTGLEKDIDYIIEEIRVALSSSLECPHVKILKNVGFISSSSNPQLLLKGAYLFEFENVPPNRIPYVMEILSNLNPFLNQFLQIFIELKESEKLRQDSAYVDLATMTAHNILGSVEVLGSDLETPESEPQSEKLARIKRQKRLMARIKYIANRLLSSKREVQRNMTLSSIESSQNSENKSELLASIVESVVREKSQLDGINGPEILFDFADEYFDLFVKLNDSEFEVILGNILDNSLEELKCSKLERVPKINLSIDRLNGRCSIIVKDNGRGIPEADIEKVFDKEFTTKESGNGLGLYHARLLTKSWNGSVSIDSSPNGTTVRLDLPTVKAPKWFPTLVEVPASGTIIVFDDDPGAHDVMTKKLLSLDISEHRIQHIFDVHSLEKKINEHQSNNSEFFVFSDFQVMGSKITGLDVIKKCGAQNQSLIVSSYYREHEITNQCVEAGLKMLPKSLIRYARYYVKGTEINGILIDDEPINHSTWNYFANKNDKNIYTFYKIEDFLNSCNPIPNYVPVYVDSQFGNNIKGEEKSLEIYNQGFENLWLCTQSDTSSIEINNFSHLRGFASKKPSETLI